MNYHPHKHRKEDEDLKIISHFLNNLRSFSLTKDFEQYIAKNEGKESVDHG
jgi:hypothetical protein